MIIFLGIALVGKTQYFPVYSQYMLNGLAINPAYAGSRDVLSSSIMYRSQWMGLEGAPSTGTFSAHTPLKNRKIGIGAQLINEKIGITNNFSLFGNYAYRINLGQGRLSFGMKFGTEILSSDYSKVSTKTSGDIVFAGKENVILPNFGFGTYYFSENYFLGLSIPAFLSYKAVKSGTKNQAYNEIKNYNYLISGGYLIWVNSNLKFKPSTLIKYYSYTPLQFDLNLNAILMKDGMLWLGFSYRNHDAFVTMAEIQMGTKWRLGVSYDYSLGEVSNYNSGSLEVMLRMELITVVKTINPRYF